MAKSPPERSQADGYYWAHSNRQEKDKDRVGRYVAESIVQDSDSVALDAGSSATAVATYLFEKRKNLSMMTHNMDVFDQYRKITVTTNELILTGGKYEGNYNALFGGQTEDTYEDFHPRVVILAISGLTALTQPGMKSGLYCHSITERRIKQILASMPTHKRVIIADSTKLGKHDSYMFTETVRLLSGVTERVIVVTTKPPPANPSQPACSEPPRPAPKGGSADGDRPKEDFPSADDSDDAAKRQRTFDEIVAELRQMRIEVVVLESPLDEPGESGATPAYGAGPQAGPAGGVASTAKKSPRREDRRAPRTDPG